MITSNTDVMENKTQIHPVQGSFYIVAFILMNTLFVHFSYNFLCEKFGLPHTSIQESLLLYLLFKTLFRGFFTIQ